MKKLVVLILIVLIVVLACSCGTKIPAQPDSAIVESDVQEYITELIDHEAKILSMQECDRIVDENGTLNIVCVATYNSPTLSYQDEFLISYEATNKAWILSKCRVNLDYEGRSATAVEEVSEESTSEADKDAEQLVVEGVNYRDSDQLWREKYVYDEYYRLTEIQKYIIGLDGKEIQSWAETYTYDAAGNVVQYAHFRDDGVKYSAWHFNYDSAGNLIKLEEESKNGTIEKTYEYIYSADGRLAKQNEYALNKLSSSQEYDYNSNGDTVSVVRRDSQGNITRRWEMEYDNRNNRIKETVINSDGSPFEYHIYTHDLKGNVLTERWEDSSGTWTDNVESYHEFPRPALPTVCANTFNMYGAVELSYSYDTDGNCTSIVGRDEQGNFAYWREFSYNQDGQRVSETMYDADGTRSSWTEYIYEER